jgi:hypothetical protein
MREKVALSIPSQTGVKGLLDATHVLLCRTATSREILEIDFDDFWNPAPPASKKWAVEAIGPSLIAGD